MTHSNAAALRGIRLHRPGGSPAAGGRVTGRAAGFGPRAESVGVDILLFLLASPAILGLSAVFLRELWSVGGIVIAAAYLVCTWSAGQSLGMRVAGIRLEECRQGRMPGAGRALVRAALCLPPMVAAFVLLDAVLGSGRDGGITATPAVVLPALALVAFGFVSHAWALVDPCRRTLHDHWSGTVVVSERVAEPARAASSD